MCCLYRILYIYVDKQQLLNMFTIKIGVNTVFFLYHDRMKNYSLLFFKRLITQLLRTLFQLFTCRKTITIHHDRSLSFRQRWNSNAGWCYTVFCRIKTHCLYFFKQRTIQLLRILFRLLTYRKSITIHHHNWSLSFRES